LRGDARARRVVVVPDSVLNPPPGASEVLSTLAAEGWGVIALPPPELERSARVSWLDNVAEQVVTFLDDDYDVALVNHEDTTMQAFLAVLRAAGSSVPRQLEFDAPDG
jgi:hypothetical protein